ncbi:hypothetical protein BN12_1800010 [Nostocoides japonicum T1-X7]|uniref:Uncharacterized protein n=1 Tax=Nostocoides japonicum T1-X7 TaxID=1194083 RepID=A0A077LUQ4_9MICO|nr:hypothetical protein BN12_1800010 [Tetrasphaera japonica T1-X7]
MVPSALTAVPRSNTPGTGSMPCRHPCRWRGHELPGLDGDGPSVVVVEEVSLLLEDDELLEDELLEDELLEDEAPLEEDGVVDVLDVVLCVVVDEEAGGVVLGVAVLVVVVGGLVVEDGGHVVGESVGDVGEGLELGLGLVGDGVGHDGVSVGSVVEVVDEEVGGSVDDDGALVVGFEDVGDGLGVVVADGFVVEWSVGVEPFGVTMATLPRPLRPYFSK